MVVTGSYGNATVTSQGSASTYVTGLNTSAVVKASGVGSVYLNTTSGAPCFYSPSAQALLCSACMYH